MMQQIKMLFFVGVMSTAGVVLVSCDSSATETTEEAMGKEYTSAYVCPMHCEGSGSEEMGTCPECGMDYVANTEHEADGHMH
jgi:hypothetical protein